MTEDELIQLYLLMLQQGRGGNFADGGLTALLQAVTPPSNSKNPVTRADQQLSYGSDLLRGALDADTAMALGQFDFGSLDYATPGRLDAMTKLGGAWAYAADAIRNGIDPNTIMLKISEDGPLAEFSGIAKDNKEFLANALYNAADEWAAKLKAERETPWAKAGLPDPRTQYTDQAKLAGNDLEALKLAVPHDPRILREQERRLFQAERDAQAAYAARLAAKKAADKALAEYQWRGDEKMYTGRGDLGYTYVDNEGKRKSTRGIVQGGSPITVSPNGVLAMNEDTPMSDALGAFLQEQAAAGRKVERTETPQGGEEIRVYSPSGQLTFRSVNGQVLQGGDGTTSKINKIRDLDWAGTNGTATGDGRPNVADLVGITQPANNVPWREVTPLLKSGHEGAKSEYEKQMKLLAEANERHRNANAEAENARIQQVTQLQGAAWAMARRGQTPFTDNLVQRLAKMVQGSR